MVTNGGQIGKSDDLQLSLVNWHMFALILQHWPGPGVKAEHARVRGSWWGKPPLSFVWHDPLIGYGRNVTNTHARATHACLMAFPHVPRTFASPACEDGMQN